MMRGGGGSNYFFMFIKLGGRGGGEGEGVTAYIKYGCAVRIAPFFSSARYMDSPHFNQNI